MIPTHSGLDPREVCLRTAGRVDERGVAGIQMREVADVVGHQRAADTSVLGPSMHARVDEGAVNDQLAPPIEEVQQADRALRSLELIVLLDRVHGIRRRWAASASRALVCSFSLTSISCRAASHSCADTIGGVFMQSPFADPSSKSFNISVEQLLPPHHERSI